MGSRARAPGSPAWRAARGTAMIAIGSHADGRAHRGVFGIFSGPVRLQRAASSAVVRLGRLETIGWRSGCG